MDQNKHKLIKLDHECEEYMKQGKYIESLELMEESLNIRKMVYGEESNEFYKTAEKLCELCNILAMLFLQKQKYDVTIEFLKKAEVLGQNSKGLKAITYNNIACYYRRIGKLKFALEYLQLALEIETIAGHMPTLADTHLNICAVYSQIGKHELAKSHIMQSIALLQEEFLLNCLPKKDEISVSKIESKDDKNSGKLFEDRIAVLAIAYHNLGVEFEYLKQYEDAIKTYKKAVNFARNYIGEEHQIVENLNNVLLLAQSQIENNMAKSKRKTNNKDIPISPKGLVQTTLTKTKTAYGFDQNLNSMKSGGTMIVSPSNQNPVEAGMTNEEMNLKVKKEKMNENNANIKANLQELENSESGSKKLGHMMTPRDIMEDSKESEEKAQ